MFQNTHNSQTQVFSEGDIKTVLLVERPLIIDVLYWNNVFKWPVLSRGPWYFVIV